MGSRFDKGARLFCVATLCLTMSVGSAFSLCTDNDSSDALKQEHKKVVFLSARDEDAVREDSDSVSKDRKKGNKITVSEEPSDVKLKSQAEDEDGTGKESSNNDESGEESSNNDESGEGSGNEGESENQSEDEGKSEDESENEGESEDESEDEGESEDESEDEGESEDESEDEGESEDESEDEDETEDESENKDESEEGQSNGSSYGDDDSEPEYSALPGESGQSNSDNIDSDLQNWQDNEDTAETPQTTTDSDTPEDDGEDIVYDDTAKPGQESIPIEDGYFKGINGRVVELFEEILSSGPRPKKKFSRYEYLYIGASRSTKMKKNVSDSRTLFVTNPGASSWWFALKRRGKQPCTRTICSYLAARPTGNVIIELGNNDPFNVETYIYVYKRLIETYPQAHFWFVDALPGSGSRKKGARKNVYRMWFNTRLQEAFPSNCVGGYYFVLNSPGFKTLDGTHYTAAMEKRIYKYIMRRIGRSS